MLQVRDNRIVVPTLDAENLRVSVGSVMAPVGRRYDRRDHLLLNAGQFRAAESRHLEYSRNRREQFRLEAERLHDIGRGTKARLEPRIDFSDSALSVRGRNRSYPSHRDPLLHRRALTAKACGARN